MTNIQQDEQHKQNFQHSNSVASSKPSNPFDTANNSPRSARIDNEHDQLFTYEQCNNSSDLDECIDANGFKHGSSGVIVDGNKVYYNHNHFHGSSNSQLSQRINNGNSCEQNSTVGGNKYASHKQSNAYASGTHCADKENKCGPSIPRDDRSAADGAGYSRFAGLHDVSGIWKKRHVNADGPTKNTSKSFANEYDSDANDQRYDSTMFPFDRTAIAYEDQNSGGSGSSGGGLERRRSGKYQMHATSSSSYYDSSSPENDSSYEQSSHRKSDGRQYKEMTIITRKKQPQQKHQPLSAKLSKYDSHKASISSKNDHHHSQNHISDPDAFITTTDATAIITNTNTSTNANTSTSTANSNKPIQNYDDHANPSHWSNATDHNNSILQFEQIASKFDKMPPKCGQSETFHMRADIHESVSVLSLHMHATPCKLTLSQPNTAQSTNSASDPYAPAGNTSPMPDLRVDFFAEPVSESQKRHSFVEIHLKQVGAGADGPANDTSPKSVHSCNATLTNHTGINVTPNPMDETTAAVTCTTSQAPRATIVVQQVIRRSQSSSIELMFVFVTIRIV